MKKEFYVGWSGEAPAGYRKKSRLFFFAVFSLATVIAVLFSVYQRGFIDSYFEYGTLTEIEGYLVDDPVPGLLTLNEGRIQTIPLVGFGKSGADENVKAIMEKIDGDFSKTKVTIRGTLFYYRDRKWMELTEGSNSLIQEMPAEQLQRDIQTTGSKKLVGEIVDPKCFFGVMNPGTKAVHRSCAIRCISGGVPPVLAIRENGEFVDYYFVQKASGELINKEILPYVGIPIELSGSVTKYNDWNVLNLEEDLDEQMLSMAMVQGITQCK